MEKIKVVIVEDEAVIAMNINDILEDLGYETVGTAGTYSAAIRLLKEEKPDIAILDIKIKGEKDGIDLATHISEEYDIPFIFLTSNSGKETVDRAKRVNPSSFLIKPFAKEDLYSTIEIALHNFQKEKQASTNDGNLVINDALFIKDKNQYYKVPIKEVVYIQSEHVYLNLYTLDTRHFLIRSSFSSLAQFLPKYFFRTHRSYMINLNLMDTIKAHTVLVADKEIPLSKRYRDELIELINIP